MPESARPAAVPDPGTWADDPAGWLEAVARELDAAGIAARASHASAGADLTVTVRPAGRREAEVILDEDGYAELRFWTSLDDGPETTAALIRRALAVVVTGQSA